jgi:lipoate-protein ligase A
MIPSVRLLPFAIADGPTNMAADEALLLSAGEGVASLRFYGWSPATLSLGYFQPAAARLSDARLAELPWVRRASGGATLVHDQEITYALALPAGLPWQTGPSWMTRFHEIVRASLGELGLGDGVSVVTTDDLRGEVLCFQKQTVGDLVCRGHKIGGSAQRKHRRAMLQHGSILLRQSFWTPALPGIFELTGVELSPAAVETAVVRHFAAAIGWTIESGNWTAEERRLIDSLAHEKFAAASWNDKR